MSATLTEWTFSVDWLEEGERGVRLLYAEQRQFANETEARAAWTNAQRLNWVEAHQHEPHVSALYRCDFDCEQGLRTKLRKRQIVGETGTTAGRRVA